MTDLTCRCGHVHASGTDGEDAGCPCSDAHDWARVGGADHRHEANYEPAVDALQRIYFQMGGNRDEDHTACTVEECHWRQAKDALLAAGRSVDTR